MFLPGETRKTIAVQVFDDWTIEGDETFRLALTNPSGDTTLLQSSVQVTLMDNERPGTPDARFTPGTDMNSQIEAIAVQPDGKIVIGGSFGLVNGVLCPGYARLNPDGSLDHGFAPESFRDGTVRVLALQADGGILLGGDFRVLHEIPSVGIGRLLPDGAVDPGFTSPLHDTGILSQYITALCVDPLGRILLAGSYAKGIEPVRAQLTRLLPNGAFDPTFGISPAFGPVQPFLAALADDGRILVAGAIVENNVRVRPYVGRLLPNGALDPTFSPATLPDGYISSILALPDGSALIAGGFTAINGIPAGRIARLLPDGTPAPFVAAGRGADDTIFAMTRQSDGRILVGGVFDHFDGVPRHRVARLNADLSLDPSFDPGAGISGPFSSIITALALESDGDVLAGGNFAAVSGAEHFNLARLRGVLAPCLSPVLAPVPSGLRLTLYVEPGRVCVLQTSTDLRTWLPWETNISANGVIQVIVPPMADAPRRFYRGWQPGPPAN
jgi:uncharacterized delta-60 repeat protein